MPNKNGKVCVRVDCRCPYAEDYLYYPKQIQGLHQVDAKDPRAILGSFWDQNGGCKGHYYSQGCEDEDCNTFGTVVEIFDDCESCQHQPDCPFK